MRKPSVLVALMAVAGLWAVAAAAELKDGKPNDTLQAAAQYGRSDREVKPVLLVTHSYLRLSTKSMQDEHIQCTPNSSWRPGWNAS